MGKNLYVGNLNFDTNDLWFAHFFPSFSNCLPTSYSRRCFEQFCEHFAKLGFSQRP